MLKNGEKTKSKWKATLALLLSRVILQARDMKADKQKEVIKVVCAE